VKRTVGLLLVCVVAFASGCSTVRRWLPGDFGSDKGPIKRVAILPFAYRAADGATPCDLCPDRVVMDVTSERDALLVTAFLYEGLARYPRIQVIPFDHVRASQGATMRETLSNLAEKEHLDAAVVGAVLELRPRLGDPREPKQRGGAAVYAALLDLPSGAPIWKRFYDRSPGSAGRIMHSYHRLVGEDERAMTDEEAAQAGITGMVPALVKALR